MVTAKEEKEMKPAIEDCIVTAAASTPRRGRGRGSEGPAWFRVRRGAYHRFGDGLGGLRGRRGAHQSGQSMGTAKYGKQLGLERFEMHFSEVELNKGDTRAFVDLPHPTNDKTPVDGDDVPFVPQKQLQNLDLPVRRKLGLHIADSATAASVDGLDNISTICRPDHFLARDMFPVDVPGNSTGQTVPQTLDEFPQAPGSDDDSIRFDDFDTLDDEDDDCQSS